ncbi:hypothetical protein [Actinoplanes sp. M2I2]|uniref:hypothetical protein n=1 Tax=Actinoplanes sp. M2I2 TaxID=1734444 RepID=UPI00202231FA|nr:hypothetical protein [Actinoplanes sp. M2I2]
MITEARAAVRTRQEVWLGAGALYLGLALLMMARFLLHPDATTSAHTAHTDQPWFEWLLQHGALSLRDLSNPLFTTRLNAPDGVNMIANTSVLGVTLPMAPLTLLWGPRVTYVIWQVGAVVATASTTCWVLRRHLRVTPAAAIVAGAFAGFAPGVVAHANGQPNYTSHFLLPLIVAAVFCGGTGVRRGVQLGLLVAYQVFINEEMLVITALACGLAAMLSRRILDVGFLRKLGVAAAVTLVITAYPIWFQFFGPGSFHAVPAYATWGEDALGYVTYWRDSLGHGFGPQKALYTTDLYSMYGVPLTVLAVLLAVLLWRHSRTTRVVVPVMAVFAVLSLGPSLRVGGEPIGPGPMALLGLDFWPFSMMMPSRMSFVVTAGVVILLALGWDRLVKGGRRHHVLILAALIPLIPTPLPAKDRPLPPEFIRSQAWRQYVPAGTTLVAFPLPYIVVGEDSYTWATWPGADFAVPEGYFLGPGRNGDATAGPAVLSETRVLVDKVFTTGVVPTVTDEMRTAARADLQRWHASAVVVRATPQYERMRELATGLLGPPQRVLDVWVWPISQELGGG